MEPVHFAEKYILTPGGIPGCVIADEVTRLSARFGTQPLRRAHRRWTLFKK